MAKINTFSISSVEVNTVSYISAYGDCPSFFSNNVITKDQMNAVYRYVMEMKVDKYPATEKYEEDGQEKERPLYHKILAAMFNDLADRINEKTS